MLGSRSNRVSSRPAPTPTGDDPPKPSTSVEPSPGTVVAAPSITTLESDIAGGSDESQDAAGAGKKDTETGIESPQTAARVAPDSESTSPVAPFLKPVPNPSEVSTETAAPEAGLAPDMTPIAELTSREQEVFMLMAHGDTNADIAEELFISEGTVKTHVKRVLAKLYMRDRTQVVVFAYEKQLVIPGSAAASGNAQFENRSFGG